MLSASRSISRHCCRPLRAISSSSFEGGDCNRRKRILTTPLHHYASCRAQSTISFDAAAAYFSNSPSSSSTEQQTVNPATTSSTNINNIAIEHQSTRQRAEEQIQQWIKNNPLIAPYKAEECLAKLWVEQQQIFDEWTSQSSPPPILITPNTVNLCISAWCYSKKGQIAAERAQRLLLRIIISP